MRFLRTSGARPLDVQPFCNGSRLREPAPLPGIERPEGPVVIRMSVQIVFTTSSKTVGARNMRPAPTADHDSSPSSLTSL